MNPSKPAHSDSSSRDAAMSVTASLLFSPASIQAEAATGKGLPITNGMASSPRNRATPSTRVTHTTPLRGSHVPGFSQTICLPVSSTPKIFGGTSTASAFDTSRIHVSSSSTARACDTSRRRASGVGEARNSIEAEADRSAPKRARSCDTRRRWCLAPTVSPSRDRTRNTSTLPCSTSHAFAPSPRRKVAAFPLTTRLIRVRHLILMSCE